MTEAAEALMPEASLTAELIESMRARAGTELRIEHSIFNEEATRLTGYSRAHLVNSTFSSYVTEPDRADEGVEMTLAADKIRGYELTLLTRHGRQVLVSFNAGVFRDTAGTALGILAAARNIDHPAARKVVASGSRAHADSTARQ